MRTSSRGVPTPGAAPRLAELCLYEPTAAQIRARAAFWVRHRSDPLVDPRQMTGEQVARTLDTPQLATWWRDAGFRNWFLQREEWLEEAEFGLLLALREITRRLRSPELEKTKELILLARTFADLTGKTRAASNTGGGADKKLSDEEAMTVFRATAIQLGFTPPADLPPSTSTIDVDTEES